MAATMRRTLTDAIRRPHRSFAVLALSLAMAAPAAAQSAGTASASFRLGASTGAWIPLSPLIRTADAFDTRLGAAPAFSVQPEFIVASEVSLYASGTAAFPALRLGSSMRPGVVGPSTTVIVIAGTTGLMLTGDGWLGEYVQPTLRLGGGFKWYGFDLTDTDNQLRPTADAGIGFRGIGSGPIEVTAEVRFLPSSFDQAKLPTRGIAPQHHRQNDLALVIGIAVRSD